VYVDHVDGLGTALSQRVCDMDLEGIVAKQKSGPYVTNRESTTWFKVLNPEYSQREKVVKNCSNVIGTRNPFRAAYLPLERDEYGISAESFDFTDGSSINEGLQENLRRLGLRLPHSFHEPTESWGRISTRRAFRNTPGHSTEILGSSSSKERLRGR